MQIHLQPPNIMCRDPSSAISYPASIQSRACISPAPVRFRRSRLTDTENNAYTPSASSYQPNQNTIRADLPHYTPLLQTTLVAPHIPTRIHPPMIRRHSQRLVSRAVIRPIPPTRPVSKTLLTQTPSRGGVTLTERSSR